jgi:hypothetical protein
MTVFGLKTLSKNCPLVNAGSWAGAGYFFFFEWLVGLLSRITNERLLLNEKFV